MELTIITIWILFCLQQGWNDARHFAHGGGHYIKQQSNKHSYNIHSSLLLGRGLVYIGFILLYFLFLKQGGSSNFQKVAFLGVGLIALFPFFHEGMYYTTRKRMDNPYGNMSHLSLWFNYSSPTTTAKLNYPGWVRAVALFGGIFAILTLIK